jgi:hypothetical protein
MHNIECRNQNDSSIEWTEFVVDGGTCTQPAIFRRIHDGKLGASTIHNGRFQHTMLIRIIFQLLSTNAQFLINPQKREEALGSDTAQESFQQTNPQILWISLVALGQAGKNSTQAIDAGRI